MIYAGTAHTDPSSMSVDPNRSGGDGADRRGTEGGSREPSGGRREPSPRDGPGGRGGPGPEDDGGGSGDGGPGFDPAVLAAALVTTALVVAVTDYALQELPPVPALAVLAVVGVGTLLLLARKRHPASAVGSGLYVTAVLLILTPFLLYVPRVTLGGESVRLMAQDVTAENVTIGGDALFDVGGFSVGNVASGDVGSIISLVVFTVVFLLAGLVVAVAGRIATSYARSKLDDGRRDDAARAPRR